MVAEVQTVIQVALEGWAVQLSGKDDRSVERAGYDCERSEQLSARGLSPRINRYRFSILFQK
jgi:hypothetical protein